MNRKYVTGRIMRATRRLDKRVQLLPPGDGTVLKQTTIKPQPSGPPDGERSTTQIFKSDARWKVEMAVMSVRCEA